MADKTGQDLSYRRTVWRRAYTDSKPARDRLIWAVVLAAIPVALAAVTGAKMIPGPDAIGALCGVAIAAILYVLWFRFRAPAKIWAENQKSIEELTRSLDREERQKLEALLAYRLELEIGDDSCTLPDVRSRRIEELIRSLEEEIDSGNFSRAPEIPHLARILQKGKPPTARGNDREGQARRVRNLLAAYEDYLLGRSK